MSALRNHSGALSELIRDRVSYEGHWTLHASAIRDIATMAADVFPEGTDTPDDRALPEVWSDREGFEAAAAAYRDAAKNLAETAATGDREASNAAFMAMAGTCHACHEKYREE